MDSKLVSRRQAIAGLSALPAIAGSAKAASPPNIVLILIDDLRWDAMGCAGHPWAKTPNLDRLASRGTRFENAFVTTSLCSPSRASILTGQYMHAHGVQDNFTKLPAALPAFPGLLQQGGYRTAFLGKWHMGDSQLIQGGEDSDAPQPGFDHWISFRGQGVYSNPVLNFNGARRKVEGYTTDILTEESVRFIERQRKDRPFALYLSHKAVHSGHDPAPRHRELYSGQDVATPGSAAVREGKPAWLLRKRDESRHGLRNLYAGAFDLPGLVRQYMRCLAAVDESVGAVEDALARTGSLENTLIVFLSDNGFLLGEQGLADKRVMHDPSIRIPLLAAWPGRIPAGSVRREMALNLDIAPTLLDAAGISRPSSMHGASLLGLFGGTPAEWRKDFVYEYAWDWEAPHTPGVVGVRTENHSYMEYQGIWDVNELYDLQRDPRQMNNLLAGAKVTTEPGGWLERVKDPETRSLTRELRSRMKAILNATGGARFTRGPA